MTQKSIIDLLKGDKPKTPQKKQNIAPAAVDDDEENPLVLLGSDKDQVNNDQDVTSTTKKNSTDTTESGADKEEAEVDLVDDVEPIVPIKRKTSPTIRPSYTFENLEDGLPDDWKEALAAEFTKPYWLKLKKTLCQERDARKQIFPPCNLIFEAFWACPIDDVRVFLCGQDPYHDDNQAIGLAFSVPKTMKKCPPSLRNMYKELSTDIKGFKTPLHGDISSWAKQGIFMLNTVLTVEAHKANSHAKFGWLAFTDAVLQHLVDHKEKLVYIFWGKPAQEKAIKVRVNRQKNCYIAGAHPSPLSAHTGFFGSKPFSQANAYLVQHGFKPIDWQV